MPRGKYVNHKGRSRKFTSPEELQNQDDEESSETETSENEDDVAKSSGAAKAKSKHVSVKSVENDSEEESSEEDDRDARKGVASLIEIENPNRGLKKSAQKLKNLSLGNEPVKPELTRREREEMEKQKARLRYQKLHAAGETSEAKADLARLALIRQKRDEATAKREAELEKKKAAAAKK